MSIPVSGYILIKLAARCNMNCSYCYWFRDETVYKIPALMTTEVEQAFLSKVEAHIRKHDLDTFRCIFHGGEPLLFGHKRFRPLLDKLSLIGRGTGCRMEYSITTNGLLVTQEWAEAFKQYGVQVAVSIDGPEHMHNRRRPTLSGRATYRESVRGYFTLRDAGIQTAVLAVCDPQSDPCEVLRHFVEDLGAHYCDILAPDLNHEDDVAPIAPYYIRLFDLWYDTYMERGVAVRFLLGLMRGVLGLPPNTDSFGYGPVHTVALSTDGTLEPLDVLRIAGNGSTRTNANIKSHSLDDVRNEAVWREAYDSALRLCQQCEECRHRNACGGGHLASRWSKERGYDNPSVYCADYLEIFDHVWERVSRDVVVTKQGVKSPLREVAPSTIQSYTERPRDPWF